MQDYDLSAVFMRNWDTRDESGTDQGCEWEKDWEDVQQVCRMLGIRCEMVCCPSIVGVFYPQHIIFCEDRPFARVLDPCL